VEEPPARDVGGWDHGLAAVSGAGEDEGQLSGVAAAFPTGWGVTSSSGRSVRCAAIRLFAGAVQTLSVLPTWVHLLTRSVAANVGV